MLPEKVTFTNLVIEGDELSKMSTAGIAKPIDTSNARIHFQIPNNSKSIDAVTNWLFSNINGGFSHYKFNNPNDYQHITMVVRFEDSKDAIMFKLQDGHRAWEHDAK